MTAHGLTTPGRIAVTGASGPFSQGVVRHLLEWGVPASDLVLLTRSPAKLAEFAASGAAVRFGDFDDLDAMREGLAGVAKMLMISALKVGFRIPQHTRAIEAARQAGVGHVIYTSFIGKEPDNPSLAVVDHRGTEDALRQSGLIWTSLRDAQYSDAFVEAAPRVPLRTGVWEGATLDGRMPFVTRHDCIRSAAAALLAKGTKNRTYNITGPEGLTYRAVSQIIADVAGKPIRWIDVTPEERYAFFDGLGIPREAVPDQSVDGVPWSSDDMVSLEIGIRDGWFDIESDDVFTLTGQRPQSFRDFAMTRQVDLQTLAAEGADQ